MSFHCTTILWRHQYAEKIIQKHQIQPFEVEKVYHSKHFVRLKERGHRQGEDLYVVYGKSISGRYIVVFVIKKGKGVVMPISARDMTKKEREFYAKRS